VHTLQPIVLSFIAICYLYFVINPEMLLIPMGLVVLQVLIYTCRPHKISPLESVKRQPTTETSQAGAERLDTVQRGEHQPCMVGIVPSAACAAESRQHTPLSTMRSPSKKFTSYFVEGDGFNEEEEESSDNSDDDGAPNETKEGDGTAGVIPSMTLSAFAIGYGSEEGRADDIYSSDDVSSSSSDGGDSSESSSIGSYSSDVGDSSGSSSDSNDEILVSRGFNIKKRNLLQWKVKRADEAIQGYCLAHKLKQPEDYNFQWPDTSDEYNYLYKPEITPFVNSQGQTVSIQQIVSKRNASLLKDYAGYQRNNELARIETRRREQLALEWDHYRLHESECVLPFRDESGQIVTVDEIKAKRQECQLSRRDVRTPKKLQALLQQKQTAEHQLLIQSEDKLLSSASNAALSSSDSEVSNDSGSSCDELVSSIEREFLNAWCDKGGLSKGPGVNEKK